MKNLNFFSKKSDLYPLRWLLISAIVIAGVMTYANVTGLRLFSMDQQERWSAGGPRFHK